jgi:thiamine-phosphate pyrophosphorylase
MRHEADLAKVASAGLYLTVAASGPAALARLTAALEAVTFASVLIRPQDKRTLDAAAARPFVELIQSHDVAALIEDDADLARALRADGVHLSHSETLDARFREAREVLGQRYIVGGEAGGLRHDAMMLGELGADYVAFAAGDGQAELVSWWAEIFELPCVARDAATPEDAAALAQLKADFVGMTLPDAGDAAACSALVRAFAGAVEAAAVA